jgi:hypothetical protein
VENFFEVRADFEETTKGDFGVPVEVVIETEEETTTGASWGSICSAVIEFAGIERRLSPRPTGPPNFVAVLACWGSPAVRNCCPGLYPTVVGGVQNTAVLA